jgi:hypothetical protein
MLRTIGFLRSHQPLDAAERVKQQQQQTQEQQLQQQKQQQKQQQQQQQQQQSFQPPHLDSTLTQLGTTAGQLQVRCVTRDCYRTSTLNVTSQ